MSLIHDIVTQLHLQCRAKQLAIGYRSRRVPDLDDVEVTLGGQGNADNRVIVALQHTVRQAVHHTIHKHGVGL